MAQVVQEVVNQVLQACRIVGANGSIVEPAESVVRIAAQSFTRRLLEDAWKFLEDEKTDTSVATVASYTLSGNSNNCGKIIYLGYDGHDFRQHYADPEEFARFYDADLAQSTEVSKWTIKGYSGKNPIATFFGTPMETGKEIFYRFRKVIDNSDPMAMLPVDMIDLVVLKMISRFHPSGSDKKSADTEYQEGLAAAKERWMPEIGLPREPQLNEEQMDRNYEINSALSDHGHGFSSGPVVDISTMQFLR